MIDRRELKEQEKKQILDRYGMYCFVNGHPIESEKDLQFDHIEPVASGGPTELNNLAPVCRQHNLQKRTMSLSEYRDYLRLQSFFEPPKSMYLDDVIAAKGFPVGQRLQYEVIDNCVRLYLETEPQTLTLYTCPTTGWQYFYALIPVQYLKNDKDLQPRALRQQSMWALYRHFRWNTQLAPSICRFDDTGALLLFDGQHKAAAQVWSGRQAVECKVYVRPAANLLKETNLEAHQTYRQMAFYSYELMKKYADISGEDWEEYAALPGVKSEKGFVEFLVNQKNMTMAKARREVAQAIQWRILQAPDNKLAPFISETTRTRSKPLTYSRIEKTFFTLLLSPVPTGVEFESDDDFRDIEEKNLVRLMSIVADEGLIGRWNSEGADAAHQKAECIFSAGAVRAWMRIIRDVLNAYLQLYLKGQEEIDRVLYRRMSDEDFGWIQKFVRQIFKHPVWEMPDTPIQEVSKRLTKDDDVTARSLLTENGLTVEWVLNSAGNR